jgi:aspartate aminotransferase-like enzyme
MQKEGWYQLPIATYTVQGVSEFIMEMLKYLQFWQSKYNTNYTEPVPTVDGGELTLRVIWELGKQDAI